MFTAPVLVPGFASHTWLTTDGEVLTLDGRQATLRLREEMPLVCHGPAAARRLHREGMVAADVLSLFAFVRPARWCVPTPAGLADACGLPRPQSGEDAALTLLEVTNQLIRELVAQADAPKMIELLWLARTAKWPFADACLKALGDKALSANQQDFSAIKVWRRLAKWEDAAPPGRPGNAPITEGEAEDILSQVLSNPAAEDRPEQRAFTRGVAPAFAPAPDQDSPALVLAEAGTGVGKTLGYLAPAFAWRQKNLGPIWLSTYTRNLQRQLDTELNKLYPNPAIKEKRVVVRKGRENYLCLMNLEELVTFETQSSGKNILGLILAVRWAEASRAGEMIGGDMPGWLREIIGLKMASELAVRRGECWHGACPHYGACYAEKVARAAPHAEVVVANHAFVMTQTLADPFGFDVKPTHYVFDEGHHLFDAADSAFGGNLSGLETRDLRRWLLGSERTSPTAFSGRARGLRKRLEDLASTDEDLANALHAVERAAQILPGSGWYDRLKNGQPKGPVEAFLGAVGAQVYARAKPADATGSYSIETEILPLTEAVETTAHELDGALGKLLQPLKALQDLIQMRLEDGEEDETQDEETVLNDDQRRRLGGIANSIRQRAVDQVAFFQSMVQGLSQPAPADFVDWFEVTRIDGTDVDVGYFRKFIDPVRPFMSLLGSQAQGALITSATLTDQTGVEEVDWSEAEAQTGTRHLPTPPVRLKLASPYDYASQARVFVVQDLERDRPNQAYAAMARLMLAAEGGGLGLFTSIQRLKAAYVKIAPKLEAANLPLLAQHVDAMDVTTLIDIFRADPRACMLGTDALRDGVDVPGESLKLLVFERMPWPRPTLPHRARREHFGKRTYDDRLTRLKLRQAFGRLIRKREDRGAFVLLDSRLPTRLESAFPQGVEIERLSLKETLAALKAFYGGQA